MEVGTLPYAIITNRESLYVWCNRRRVFEHVKSNGLYSKTAEKVSALLESGKARPAWTATMSIQEATSTPYTGGFQK